MEFEQPNKEMIGKVLLDYTNYTGEDLYSDGDIEEEMLQIAMSIEDNNYDEIIRNRKSWPILYHFAKIRENIISWYPFEPNSSLLEIGSGCGAITGGLAQKAQKVTCVELSKRRSHISAWRHKNKSNIEIKVGNFQDIEKNNLGKFDYITLIGVFEYSAYYVEGKNPFITMLQMVQKHLIPGGHVLIAIENRLGLKYWAGCREDHNGKLFSGLKGYPSPEDKVYTFSKPEIEKMLHASGFKNISFYYPYPDYKLPDILFSDDHLPQPGELYVDLRNYDQPRLFLFEESEVFNTLIKDGLFPLFSNSYFIDATMEAR